MFQAILNIYIELMQTSLQYPHDLPILLQRTGVKRVFFAFGLIGPTLSTAVGMYLLRDYYSKYYYVEILFLWIIHLVMLGGWSFILGSVVNALVDLIKPERNDQGSRMILISVFAATPFLFTTPGAIVSHSFSNQTLAVILVTLALTFWSMYILFQGIRYSYELALRDALVVFLLSNLISFLFPFVFFVFLSTQIMEFFS